MIFLDFCIYELILNCGVEEQDKNIKHSNNSIVIVSYNNLGQVLVKVLNVFFSTTFP